MFKSFLYVGSYFTVNAIQTPNGWCVVTMGRGINPHVHSVIIGDLGHHIDPRNFRPEGCED
jgi:hypothetical protein